MVCVCVMKAEFTKILKYEFDFFEKFLVFFLFTLKMLFGREPNIENRMESKNEAYIFFNNPTCVTDLKSHSTVHTNTHTHTHPEKKNYC